METFFGLPTPSTDGLPLRLLCFPKFQRRVLLTWVPGPGRFGRIRCAFEAPACLLTLKNAF